MEISFFEINGWEKKILRKGLKNFQIKFFKNPLGAINIKKATNSKIISIFVYSKTTKSKNRYRCKN